MLLFADGDPLWPPQWSDLGDLAAWAAPPAVIVASYLVLNSRGGNWLAGRVARAIVWWRGR